jgi:hypothetical protein
VLAEIEQNLVARDHDIGRTQIQIAPRQPAAMEVLNRLGRSGRSFRERIEALGPQTWGSVSV